MKKNKLLISIPIAAFVAAIASIIYLSDNPKLSAEKFETTAEVAKSTAVDEKIDPPLKASSNSTTSSSSRTTKKLEKLLSPVSIDDKFHAYQLIQKCVSARDSAKLLLAIPIGNQGAQTDDRYAAMQKNIQLACEGISETDIRDRLSYLKEAAVAKFPGAAAEFWKAGPFGDSTALSSRLEDPLVRAWLTDSLELLQESARAKDVSALSTLSHIYQSGEYVTANKVKALAYERAALEITRSSGGQTAGRERLVKVLALGLSPEEMKLSQRITDEVLGN